MEAGSIGAARLLFPDSQQIHRLLFGVFYEEDVFEKFCHLAPGLMRAFGGRLDPEMHRRNLIFIHVPRVAGTSISHALYGPRCTHHYSIRYYRTVAPRFFAAADSFALLRDPFDRFASAYAFVRAGGTAQFRLSDAFVRQTAAIANVDDYLAFLEDRDVYSLDFVMRPQTWFVSDLATGAPLVKNLFLYDQDGARLAAYLKRQGVASLERLNSCPRLPLFLTARQKSRIESFYAQDFALIAALKRQRKAETVVLGQGIAAE